jgi:hypothetical protein
MAPVKPAGIGKAFGQSYVTLEDEAPFASRGPQYPGRGGGGQAMGCALLATSTAISK